GRRVLRRGEDADGRRRRHPGRVEGPRHRPGVGRGVRRGALGRGHGVLERPDGRVRAGAVRRGHPRGGAGDRRLGRLQRRGRRRLGRRGARARPARGRVLAHLHRRWRLAGVPGGQDLAWHRRTGEKLMAVRKPLIAGNWKMNCNHLEAIALVQKIAFALPEKYYDKVEVAVLPPFTDIRSVQTLIDGDKLKLVHGAQDLSPHDSGAYTGDVSGAMLAKLGCRYVVVGHSERREYHGEDDALVN